ncbi:uncharacterized protein LOC129762079 [Toxorhynchites rutilus septentrionalis]|uniref:uncharacterized protein LOC129762079 n=1 Tax=Toxorhynchites rutilus septentrionalis TaxID=329112 RepID=UPI002479BF45|nr:uncharacterized protein LOC129762079 [Toxorhynchites rutilus septentrionalis]XP_055616050.1 uncharacterized protein LOC129762079 [Toxorhynchites rutilus septentrionalis]
MGTVECPVCTLYLRADMSLEDHLETHPKDQVIRALVSLAAKPPATPPSAPAAAASTNPVLGASSSMELAATRTCSSRSHTPPNALMYHTNGYEPGPQASILSANPSPIVTNSVPTAIAVVKASDMGFPINNVMIVKSCSAKFVHQTPPGGNNHVVGGGHNGTTTSYASSSIDSKNVFIEPDRGGESGTTSITVRRQIPSLYPRYTNERYSGPPPPYSTAVSSTISASSQLQQASISGFASRYEPKTIVHQPNFYPHPPPAPPLAQSTSVTTASLQYHQIYQQSPPPPPLPMNQQASEEIQQMHEQFPNATNMKARSFSQAQYTEKDDGDFLVTENPKQVIEYTEIDEGEFMVIEKIIKSPSRVVQIPNDTECPSTSTDDVQQSVEEEKDEPQEVEHEECEMDIEEEHKSLDKNDHQEQSRPLEIVENDDGTFADSHGSFGCKEMPKPMLVSSIGTGKKCNKFNFIVEPSDANSACPESSFYSPRKKLTSGLKVLSNVKVTTDLSQGIKDIILNLNCKTKTTTVPGCSGTGSSDMHSKKQNLTENEKSTAVVNNNCQNELIINTNGNMPPIDLNNVNNIEIINDDEEDNRSDVDDECYVGSMEVKASTDDGIPQVDSGFFEARSPQSTSSSTTPTSSVITSVIRMTPYPSPVIAQSTSPEQPQQAALATFTPPLQPPESEPSIQEKTVATVSEIPSTSKRSSLDFAQKSITLPITKKHTTGISSVPLFNKPPKKLTVKLKTPLPPAPPPTPPPIPAVPYDNNATSMVVPKVEHSIGHVDDQVEQSNQQTLTLTLPSRVSDSDKSEENPPEALGEEKYSTSVNNQQMTPQIGSATQHEPFVHERTSSIDTVLNTSTTEVIRTSFVTAKTEQDYLISETITFTQSSTQCSDNNSSEPSTSFCFHETQHLKDGTIPIPSPPQEDAQDTLPISNQTECYKITFIEDESAIINKQQKQEPDVMASVEEPIPHELEPSASSSSCSSSSISSTGIKPELGCEQKAIIAELCSIEMDPQVHLLSPHSGSHASDSKSAISLHSEALEPPRMSFKNIKVENVETFNKNELEQLVSLEIVSGGKLEHDIEKLEPPTTDICDPKCDKSEEQKDHKDFLEAGPSRATVTATIEVDERIGKDSQSRAQDSEPVFLEYSAEYDDYVPVNGYGNAQGQIPLSWVQKFSPQYTPFDDQNSYIDLDMCSSKTNSNSITSASGSRGSVSRIESSMDRAPSAESLNIRTDEKMPAKGEISEQESNGDMELSWNRLYPVHENIPIYPSSYDLSTAQECWNLTNRNPSAHNNSTSSSTSNNNNSTGLVSSSSIITGTHSEPHLSHHQTHHSHGIGFQFSQHDQQRQDVLGGGEDQMDDKSKIHLNYGASGSAEGNYMGVIPSGSSGSALQGSTASKLIKNRTYRCSECPKSFSTVKQRRVHMISEHEIESKVHVLSSAAVVPAAATATTGGISSTITSGSALNLFADGSGEGSSTAMLSKKIKIEPQPILMSYSALKHELEQKLEIGLGGSLLSGPSRKRTYVCGTCKQEFDTFKLFNAHLMIHPAECCTCGRSFRHWSNFALHVKRHLGIKDHQCRVCGKKFVIKQKLIEHMRVHTGKAPIKCPDCDQHFRRFSNLAQHRNRHHLNKISSKKDYVCHCGEVFQSKAKMEWHKEIHENKPKSCPFCREKFIHKNSLTRHIRLSHTEKYVKLEMATEMCTICNQPYIKTSMKRHMETHTEERMAYSCTICNKLFSTNWNLKQHKWTHANPTLKPFQCNMCPSGFVREADYITHMNAHKSIRPYTCNHCGCQFIRKYNWIRHTREHEMDKNYTCEICGRKFHRKYYLTEHKRIHTGERPFSCNICGKTSSTKTNHNKHIKIHHARDPLTAEG